MAKGFTALPLFVFSLGSECIEFTGPVKETGKLTSISPTSVFSSNHETGSRVSLLNQNGRYSLARLALMSLWIIHRIGAPKKAVKTPGLQMGREKIFFPRCITSSNASGTKRIGGRRGRK